MIGEYYDCDICGEDSHSNLCAACFEAGQRCYRDSGAGHTLTRRTITRDDDCNLEGRSCRQCLGYHRYHDRSISDDEYIDKKYMQLADQKRLLWKWSKAKENETGQQTSALYDPVIQGKWWSPKPERPAKGNRVTEVSHIGRIMETELGEQRLGKNRCDGCQENDHECWVYSKEGGNEMVNAGDDCARCRCKRGVRCSFKKGPQIPGKRSASYATLKEPLDKKGRVSHVDRYL